MLMPSIGSISGVVHLTARRPYIIAVVILLLTLAAVETVPNIRQASISQSVTIHQSQR